MKILQYVLVASFGLFLLKAESQAATKGQVVAECSQALSDGDYERAKQLASEISLFINVFSPALKTDGVQCLNSSYGEGWFYDDASGSFLNNDPIILQKSLAGLSASDLNDRTAKLASVRAGIEERLLKQDKKRLEKHVACVSVMISDVTDNIISLDEIVNQANQSLITLDTYKSCSSLYETDQNAAMLNQSCIEAFQRIGHPKLELKESVEKSALSNELNELTKLKDQLSDNLLSKSIKILENNGSVITGGIKQAVEAKSCAEFGYENVYLD